MEGAILSFRQNFLHILSGKGRFTDFRLSFSIPYNFFHEEESSFYLHP